MGKVSQTSCSSKCNIYFLPCNHIYFKYVFREFLRKSKPCFSKMFLIEHYLGVNWHQIYIILTPRILCTYCVHLPIMIGDSKSQHGGLSEEASLPYLYASGAGCSDDFDDRMTGLQTSRDTY